MGVVVIGGLILSTVLTLVIVPAGFSLADSFEQMARTPAFRRMLTYRPGDDEQAARAAAGRVNHRAPRGLGGHGPR